MPVTLLQKLIRFIHKNFKESLLTTFILSCCLLFFVVFPIKSPVENATALISFFFLIPFLYFRFLLKKDFFELGFQIGNWKKGILFSLVSLFVFSGIFLLLFYQTKFSDYYVLSENLRNNFLAFVFYNFFRAIFSLSLFEIFFRGFLMLGFSKELKYWSILLQFLAFLVLLFFLDSFNLQHLFLIFSALFSGIITYQSRSLLYSFVTTFLFLLFCDLYLIKFIIQ